jgi:excisionase family DNA binding protein
MYNTDMVNKERGQITPSERVERARMNVFYARLDDRIMSCNQARLSMADFGRFCSQEFCSQEDHGIARVVNGQSSSFLTIDEVATYFGVHRRTISRMSQGELPRIKVGSQYRIPTVAVVLFISVGLWHGGEGDREKRMAAMANGDLKVLPTDEGTVADLWEKYIKSKLVEVPQSLSWSELIKGPSAQFSD